MDSSTINIWDEVKSFETVMGALSGTPFQQNILKEMGKSLVLCEALKTHGLNAPLGQHERGQLLATFCQKQRLEGDDALNGWLRNSQKNRAHLLDALDYTERIERLKSKVITEQAIQERFVSQKSRFDSVVFSLIRTDSESKITELFHKTANEGQDFATLARTESIGPEAPFGGLVGPRHLSELNPELQAKLLTLQPDELTPPFSLDGKAYLIIRLHRLDVAQPQSRCVDDVTQ